jgi:hypothetical protein
MEVIQLAADLLRISPFWQTTGRHVIRHSLRLNFGEEDGSPIIPCGPRDALSLSETMYHRSLPYQGNPWPDLYGLAESR